MQILLIKTSSMGDIIHTLPALTDAMKAIPNLEIDWVVEPAFSDIPKWHPAVKDIIPIALRKWKKNIFNARNLNEIKNFYQQLRKKKYDAVIDAQGLLKSALVAKLAHGTKHGYDRYFAREKIASFFYDKKHSIDKKKYTLDSDHHIIFCIRKLFSCALNYPLPSTEADFHIDPEKLPALNTNLQKPNYVFLHGTTWDSKLYPDSYWCELIQHAAEKNITVYLPWGNDTEKNRAEKLALNNTNVTVLPRLSIAEIASLLHKTNAVIAVDTGFAHLSAALKTPTITLYGSSNAKRLGISGKKQIHLQAQFPCSPCESRTCIYAKTHQTKVVPACYESIGPDTVWNTLQNLLNHSE